MNAPPEADLLSREVSGWPDPQACVLVVGDGEDSDGEDGDGVLAAHGDPEADRRWASVTKLLTALTVLVLVHDGEADLAAPAGPPGATLAHLLDHTSGLDFDSDQVRAAPGTRRIYSNAGMEAAAQHVEDLTGARFPELLAHLVTGPLAMARTRLDGSPAHGLIAPAADLALLARELLAPRVLPVAVVDLLRTPSRPGLAGVLPGFGRQAHNDWGLGAEVRADKSPHWTSPDADPSTFGHFGQSGTALWVERPLGLACVIAAQEPFGPWAAQAWPPLGTLVRQTWGRPAR